MGRIIQDVEMAGQNSPNLREISELQNEGGSDVFTSTRHINNTENNSDYKLKFWTQDDAPIIRPLFKPEGYGGAGCERVTKLGARTTKQTYLGYGLLVLGSATVCALLVKMKQPKKSSQQ